MPTHAESDETMGETLPRSWNTHDEVLGGGSQRLQGGSNMGGSNMGHYRCLRAGCGKEFELPDLPVEGAVTAEPGADGGDRD